MPKTKKETPETVWPAVCSGGPAGEARRGIVPTEQSYCTTPPARSQAPDAPVSRAIHAPPTSGRRGAVRERKLDDGDLPVEIRQRYTVPPHLRDFPITHYWKRFWVPYLCAKYKSSIARLAALVLEILWSFGAGETNRTPQGTALAWPSLRRIAQSIGFDDYRVLKGRPACGVKRRVEAIPGALDILIAEGLIAIAQETGPTLKPQYIFEVIDVPPLLAPAQLALLPVGLQEAHGRELAGWQHYYATTEQIPSKTLPS